MEAEITRGAAAAVDMTENVEKHDVDEKPWTPVELAAFLGMAPKR